MQNAGLDESQAGIKIAGRNINNLRYVDDTTLTAESERNLGCLHILAIVNSCGELAVVKIGVRYLFNSLFSFPLDIAYTILLDQ